MSRYTLLLLMNLPFILAGIVNAITQYKLGKIRKKRFLLRTCLWISILLGLLFAKPIYTWLFESKLTDSESLSLFDVVQTTGILLIFYIANKTRLKLEEYERRFNDLQQEISIKLSEKN